ncbi:MAG: hypothetical protein ACK544_17915 [Microcystis sp.]|nr:MULTISPECIES: hypothetical protein [unclassified Microcystis]
MRKALAQVAVNYPDVPFPEAGIADLKTADDRADIYLRETTTSA